MSQDQHAGRDHNIKIGNITIEKVEQFTYLGTALINKISIHKKKLYPSDTPYSLSHIA